MQRKAILLTITLYCFSFLALAAPSAELWSYWLAHDENSKVSIDHSSWNQLLQKYVVIKPDGDAYRVNYAAFTNNDKQQLNSYIKQLEAITISKYNQQEQRAYWINLYNALTVKVILDHYPVSSILKITYAPSWMFWIHGPWDEKLVHIEHEDVSLNDIEHRILRPIWQDDRLHFALNCASIGCPNLREIAYTKNNTEKMLNENRIAYINSPRGLSFDGKQLIASSIFDWYMIDFASNKKDLLNYFSQYTTPKTTQALQRYNGDIQYKYDWNLNASAK